MENKLKKIIAKTFNCKISEIKETTTINKIKQWDSLNHYKLVANIEKEFKLKFKEGEPETLTSLKFYWQLLKLPCIIKITYH